MTASKTKDIQDGSILLHEDWKLLPVDSRNWELCHRYEVPAKGARKASDGKTWHRCGRYYSYNTIDCALLYVADQLMKDKCRDAAMLLDVAAAEWKATVRELERAVVGKVGA